MDPTFPYAGHEHSPLWWALALTAVAFTTFALMGLFLVRATKAYETAPRRVPGKDRPAEVGAPPAAEIAPQERASCDISHVRDASLSASR